MMRMIYFYVNSSKKKPGKKKKTTTDETGTDGIAETIATLTTRSIKATRPIL